MSKLVANMVLRNEADNYLPEVMARVASQVDLICVTDDASTDNTVEIAAQYDAKIQRMKEPTFNHDEGALRQASWDHLERTINYEMGWWVLAIDADEMLYETRYTIRQLIEQDLYDVMNIEFYHMWSEKQYRWDKAWKPHPSTRLFRYFQGGRFNDRKLACGSEPTYVANAVRNRRYMQQSGLVMKHLSYIKDEDKRAKYERYASIDGGAFHANAHIESILDEDPVLLDWILDG